MPRELLIHVRVIGAKQLRNRTILPNLALEEQLGLTQHCLPQRVVEAGKERPVGISGVDVAHLQPLANEVAHEPGRAPVSQQALYLRGQHGGLAQGAGRRDIDQLVIRKTPPEKKRQPRRELEV